MKAVFNPLLKVGLDFTGSSAPVSSTTEATLLRQIQLNQAATFTIFASGSLRIIQGTTQNNIFMGSVVINAGGSFTAFAGSDSEIKGV